MENFDAQESVVEFLQGKQYRIITDGRGRQAVLPYCPFCKGGEHKDKNTFTINYDTGLYSCYRGTCGAKGNVYTLIKHFNLQKIGNIMKQKRKHYKKPTSIGVELTKDAKNWLLHRGISVETAKKYGVTSKPNGDILFNFYENGKLTFVKTRFLNPKDNKTMRDKGTKPILYLMDYCSDGGVLYITEGECDALILRQYFDNKYPSTPHNVVSIPSGSSDSTWIDPCWDWLNAKGFSEICLIGDNDDAGLHFVDEVAPRLSVITKVSSVEYGEDCVDGDDINSIYIKYGDAGLDKLLQSKEEIGGSEFILLSDVEYNENNDREYIPSSIPTINRSWGGYALHEVTVLTGATSSGKSTILGAEILTAREAGYKVAILSGEQSNEEFKSWLLPMSAGRKYVNKTTGKYGEPIYRVDPSVVEKINNWMGDYISLFNTAEHGLLTAEETLNLIKIGYNRYGFQIFVLDNLATIRFGGTSKDIYLKQMEFMQELMALVKSPLYPIHVVVVIHQNKGDDLPSIGKTDGAKQLSDLAHNSLGVSRVNNKVLDKVESEWKVSSEALSGADGFVALLKNRRTGRNTDVIATSYDAQSRRTYEKNNPIMLNYQYGWDKYEDVNLPF